MKTNYVLLIAVFLIAGLFVFLPTQAQSKDDIIKEQSKIIALQNEIIQAHETTIALQEEAIKISEDIILSLKLANNTHKLIIAEYIAVIEKYEKQGKKHK